MEQAIVPPPARIDESCPIKSQKFERLSPTFKGVSHLQSAARYLGEVLDSNRDNVYNRVKAKGILDALALLVEGEIMLESSLADLGFLSCSTN